MLRSQLSTQRPPQVFHKQLVQTKKKRNNIETKKTKKGKKYRQYSSLSSYMNLPKVLESRTCWHPSKRHGEGKGTTSQCSCQFNRHAANYEQGKLIYRCNTQALSLAHLFSAVEVQQMALKRQPDAVYTLFFAGISNSGTSTSKYILWSNKFTDRVTVLGSCRMQFASFLNEFKCFKQGKDDLKSAYKG